MNVKILMLGDVVGEAGRRHLASGGRLRRFISENRVTLTVVNGENSAEGNGITPTSARALREAGADVITGGNHTLQKSNIYTLLDDGEFLLRPANYPPNSPGTGHLTVDADGCRILVVNLSGQVFMDPKITSPFLALDSILEAEKGSFDVAVVDIHAEATSEKLALGRYADGRVAAVVGTHTHIPTADLSVLPHGTGYITDLGMCGSHAGVIGVKTECVLHRFKSMTPVTFESAEGEVSAEGAMFTVDTSCGRCVEAVPVRL